MARPRWRPTAPIPPRDGHTVVLGTTNDAEWQRLSRQIIERDDLADDPRLASNSGRCAHRDILDEAIGAWCAEHDLDHIQKTADAAGIGNSRYNMPERSRGPSAAQGPRPLAAGRNTGRPDSGAAAAPVIAGYRGSDGAVPGLGQHTDAVLADLGLGADEIDGLRAQRAVGPAYS